MTNPGEPDFKRTTLVDQITEGLRDSIRAGLWAMQLPAERVLCKSFDVSRPILRRALHALQDEGLLRITRGHPAKIIGGFSGTAARSQEKRVVLLFGENPDSVSSWPLIVIDEMRKEFHRHGFHFELVVELRLGGRGSGAVLEKLVRQAQADYWILAKASAAVQRWFQDRKLKLVMMGNTFPQITFSFVNDDLRAVTRHAAGVFLGLGHRDIVYMMRNLGSAGEAAEEAGFVEAFQGIGSAAATHRVVKHSGQVDQIRSRLQRMFTQRPHPTAILISHAMDTLVAMSWFLEKGIRIPTEVSLISFQWESFLDRLRPLPAWYYTDPREHARKICRLVTHPTSKQGPANLTVPTFFKNNTVARV